METAIINPVVVLLNNILLTKSQEEINELSELPDINEEMILNVFVQTNIDENGSNLMSAAAVVEANLNGNANKELFIVNKNKLYMSFRIFQVLNINPEDKEPKVENISSYINLEELIKYAKTEKLVDLLKEELKLLKINDEIFLLAGKASKATWDIIKADCITLTSFSAEKNATEYISGYSILFPQNLEILKKIYDAKKVDLFNKDLSPVIKNKGS